MQGENEDPGIIYNRYVVSNVLYVSQMLSLKGLNWYGNIRRPL